MWEEFCWHPVALPFKMNSGTISMRPLEKPLRTRGLEIRPETEVRFIKGVGERVGQRLNRLGIFTLEDLLRYFPRRHIDRSKIQAIRTLLPGREATVIGRVVDVQAKRARSGLPILRVSLTDSTGYCRLMFFNQTYLADRFRALIGKEIIVFGEVGEDGYLPVFKTPEWEELGPEGRADPFLPVYSLTEGLNQGQLRRLLRSVLPYAGLLEDFIPQKVREDFQLLPLEEAIRGIHFPQNWDQWQSARRRLVFEELFILQTALALKKREREAPGIAYKSGPQIVQEFCQTLPFDLTQAQKRVLRQILEDMSRPHPMNRLLQGDVGAGKTVVAAATALVAVKNGYQVAVMAPTEILAEQHFRVFYRLLKPTGVEVHLLIGSLPVSEKARIYEGAATGKIPLIVGTHALIQEDLTFNRLGLVIIDEQHRFGVIQRALLREKGQNPDVLIMTATPIPRTLSLTVYGDLDISIIDELPPGRKPVITHWRTPDQRQRVYQGLRQLLQQGRQAYVVCPLIEESENLSVQAATEMANYLQREVFPEYRVGLLYGSLPPGEKDAVMEAFRRGEIHILVSTTVVEVGVDVPNATVILIEDADRFGLAQLHQLRGRVGRGEYQSYCILLADPKSEEGKRRLQVMCETNDGFRIAEEDLRLRGPGELSGTRQSGLPDLRIADLIQDLDILEEARRAAFALVRQDPNLQDKDHSLLRRILLKKFENLSLLTVS